MIERTKTMDHAVVDSCPNKSFASTLAMAALGIALGLGVAGVGLLVVKSQMFSTRPVSAVALVDGSPICRSQSGEHVAPP